MVVILIHEYCGNVIVEISNFRVSGGELFDHVCARECLDEVEAAAFVRQILLGIKHLHSLHIVHLDIKVTRNLVLIESERA